VLELLFRRVRTLIYPDPGGDRIQWRHHEVPRGDGDLRASKHTLFLGVDVGDGDLNLDSGLDVDLGDVLDDGLSGVEVDEALVDAHLVAVPSVGTITARALASGDAEGAGGQADGALDLDLLVGGAAHQVADDLLQSLGVAAGQGDADLVKLSLILLSLLDDGGH
jgi:hypothetical protein